MRKNRIIKNNIAVLFLCLLSIIPSIKVKSQSFVEEFDNFNLLWTNGWDSINHSTTIGGYVTWLKGTCMPAYSGPIHSTISTGPWVIDSAFGIINVWLITPVLALQNGDVIHFYTVSCDSQSSGAVHPDRLQIRFSTNGASANVGTTDTSVGDFTNLLLDINPNYNTVPPPIGYSGSWYHYALTISGLPSPAPGRFAFRYFVENAQGNGIGGTGPGTNASGISIDSLAYISVDDKGVGLKEIYEKQKLTVIPNASRDVFRFIFSDPEDGIRQIEIRNLLGEEILFTKENEINLSKYSNGVYFYSVRTRKGIFVSGRLLKE